nr:unnamed protein product [Spirometra erinaceieuropaei]
MLYDGERETAREVMRKTFAEIKFMQLAKMKTASANEREDLEANPIAIVNQAVSNCMPVLILHSVRRGGFIYKVPAPPRGEEEALHIAIRRILESANSKPKNQRIWVSLARELVAASRNEGKSIRTILSKGPLSRLRRLICLIFQAHGRNSSTTTALDFDQARIRNVGLIAHIDAGKTTTTERMLYLSGQTQAMGEVDRGDTVTDFLAEERERGISIMSATACLSWKRHAIHLIDTPGHVDFTLEVERSLAVVDSALTIIDACKGVETQTRTVWTQADRHDLPRMVFINKMDRPAADFEGSLKSLQRKLGQKRTFLPLHLPIFTSSSPDHKHKQSSERHFVGLVDLPHLDLKVWNRDVNKDEYQFSTVSLLAKPAIQEFSAGFPGNLHMKNIVASALKAREHLISMLAELDEEFAEEYLSLDHPELLTPETINRSIRRATIASSGIPVLVGSSKQNIGVQLIMDALVQYLPDPSQRSPPPIIAHYLKRLHGLSASASKLRPATTLNSLPMLLVFKILFDPHWGALTLTRVYSGNVTAGAHISNWTRQDEQTQTNESIGRVLQLNGDSYKALRSAGPGCIVALTGLQSTRTGDVLGPPGHMSRVTEPAKTVADAQAIDPATDHLDPAFEQEFGVHVPEPVVHAALEPRSVSAIRGLERALSRTQREDPSFTANFNSETGQWVIGGMGDLHLEVILSRLRREYKLDVAMGPLLTTYKEMPLVADLDGSQTHIKGSARAVVVKTGQVFFEKSWAVPTGSAGPPTDYLHSSVSWKKVTNHLREACDLALATGGPLMRSRVVGVSVHIRSVGEVVGNDSEGEVVPLRVPPSGQALTSLLALLRAATMQAVTSALHELSDWRLMEPIMTVEIQLTLDDGKTTLETTFEHPISFANL